MAGFVSSEETSLLDDGIERYLGIGAPASDVPILAGWEQYHWADGFGNYYNTNEPNYDPSKDAPGNWQLMTPAQ
jgi:hypothetical protein